jgi:hypothetical protein
LVAAAPPLVAQPRTVPAENVAALPAQTVRLATHEPVTTETAGSGG